MEQLVRKERRQLEQEASAGEETTGGASELRRQKPGHGRPHRIRSGEAGLLREKAGFESPFDSCCWRCAL